MERGKVSVSARGARKPKSKFAAASQAFCFSEFVIFEGKGFLALTQAEPVKFFHRLQGDFDMYCAAAFFAEMLDAMILPGMPAEPALRLMYRTLSLMVSGAVPPDLAAAVFQVKFFQLEGLAPEETICTDKGARDALNYILSSEINKSFDFRLSERSLKELGAAVGEFRAANVDIVFKSLTLNQQ